MPKAISEKRPWYSNSIGCHPSQVKEFNEALRELGVKNAGYTADGRGVAYSDKGRNELMKANNMQDNDACYGQHSGS